MVTSGSRGSNVSWSSNNVAISNTGIVTRNSIDIIVTLTATATYNDATVNKQFMVTVSGNSQTENENYGTYYDGITAIAGDALKSELRTLITETHTYKTTYDDCTTMLVNADADPNIEGNVILFYTSVSVEGTWDGGTTWNREHIWAQSLADGWFGTSGAGSDLHHIRPTDPSVNSTRGNMKYGNVTDGTIVYFDSNDQTSAVAGEYLNDYFEPNDNVKGDVARIIFYLMTRYSESDDFTWTSIAESYAVLKAWHEADPVSEAEIARNNYIYSVQGNRNPFIDIPNYAEAIWG